VVAAVGGGERGDCGGAAAAARRGRQAIAAAITDRAQDCDAGPRISLDILKLMPSSYDDPDSDPGMGPPVAPGADRRPNLHQLQVTREAVDVIAAGERRVRDLGAYYGLKSQEHLAALTTRRHELAQLFDMGLGAATRVSKHGELSLLVSTASGLVYAVVYHRVQRRCADPDCKAIIRDDGATWPAGRPPTPGHQHTPSYPLDSPPPANGQPAAETKATRNDQPRHATSAPCPRPLRRSKAKRHLARVGGGAGARRSEQPAVDRARPAGPPDHRQRLTQDVLRPARAAAGPASGRWRSARTLRRSCPTTRCGPRRVRRPSPPRARTSASSTGSAKP
jgi:hypothetical protein